MNACTICFLFQTFTEHLVQKNGSMGMFMLKNNNKIDWYCSTPDVYIESSQ